MECIDIIRIDRRWILVTRILLAFPRRTTVFTYEVQPSDIHIEAETFVFATVVRMTLIRWKGIGTMQRYVQHTRDQGSFLMTSPSE